MSELIFAFWFFLPAGLANVAPVIANKIPLAKRWQTPMDFGLKYRGRRVFGDHKTWRGLVAGIVMGTIVVWLEHGFANANYSAWMEVGGLDYRSDSILLLGPLLGAGALLGDAIKSFFKRRHNIKPGKSWFPFDQTDYIIGGCLMSLFVTRLALGHYVLILALWTVLHLVTAYIGYLLKLKDVPI